MPQLVDAGEIAELLGLGRDTVLSMARRGEIPRVKLNRQVVRFDPARVREAIQQRSDQLECVGA